MSFQITRDKLYKAKYDNVVSLAKFLKIKECFCEYYKCKINLIEKVVREVNKI